MTTRNPEFAHGKICYVAIPSRDVDESVAFYQRVFGWETRRHDDGSLAFEDSVGQVGGTWVLDRAPMTDAGIIVSIMVADAAATCTAILDAGGAITKPIDSGSRDRTAWFRDPSGNVFGIFEQRGLA